MAVVSHLLFITYLASPWANVQAWTAEWIRLEASSAVIPPRSGHVTFAVGDVLYLFGGYAEEAPDHRYCIADLWKFEANDWKCATSEFSRLPRQRLVAAGAQLHGRPIIIGGWDSQQAGTGGIILNDVAAMDQSSGTFDTLLELDETMSRHVAVSIDPGLVLIHNHRCVGHVLLLEQKTPDATPVVRKQATTGEAPSPRGLHGACLLGQQRLVIFGGAAQDQTMSNEVFTLNLKTWNWTRCRIPNDGPSPRASPCIASLSDHEIVVFGGAEKDQTFGLKGCNDIWLLTFPLESLSSNTPTWKLLQTQTAIIPPKRNAATLDRIPVPPGANDANGMFFLLSGGWDPFRLTYNDNYVLCLSQK